MRAQEFTINIPINIKINGDGEPEVSASQAHDEPELQDNPVMVPPLQQHLELAKAGQGKESPVIDKLTADDSIGSENDEENHDPDADLLDKIKQLISR
jgi:hypothetical protein